MQASSHPASADVAPRWDPLTRRRLLQVSAFALATAVAAQLPRVLTGAAPALVGSMPALSRSRFMPLVGQRVTLRGPGGSPVRARLDSVQDFPGRRLSSLRGSEDAFILLFHGPSSPQLGQDPVQVSHPRLGRVELLLSPTGSSGRGQVYAAVINRARPPRH